jgi:hypothetical protein
MQPSVLFEQALNFSEEPSYVLVFEYGEAPGMAAVAASFRLLPYLLELACHYYPLSKK